MERAPDGLNRWPRSARLVALGNGEITFGGNGGSGISSEVVAS